MSYYLYPLSELTPSLLPVKPGKFQKPGLVFLSPRGGDLPRSRFFINLAGHSLLFIKKIPPSLTVILKYINCCYCPKNVTPQKDTISTPSSSLPQEESLPPEVGVEGTQ